jgi:sensor histidine kinase YesM
MKWRHLIAWTALYFGWYYFRYQDYPSGTAWWVTLVKVVDLAAMVYLTNYLLIPFLLYRKRYVAFGLIFLVMVFGCSLGKMYVEEWVMHRPHMFSIWNQFKVRVYDNVIPHFLLVSTGAAFKLMRDYAGSQKKLLEITREKSQAELNFLRSQVNPHVVFNSLNAIYFLIDKENAGARGALLQFSDLLRYQLYDCNAEWVAIEKEVRYLEDYIRLQRLRRDQQYEIQMEVSETVKDFPITPLILIPFVENAFKHISHDGNRRNFVNIRMERENGSFYFEVENSKDMGSGKKEEGGIGLNNVRRRLMLLYPARHALKISGNDATFKVELKLDLP